METKTEPYEPVHWAIVVKAREGKEDELGDALARFVQRSLDDPGATGVHLFRPTPGSGKREFLLHRSFLSKDHSRRFYESDLFREYQRETDHLIEGEALFRPLHGFEAFFRGCNNAPPRWKMAILTWVGVFPTALLWSSLISPQLYMLHPVAVSAVVTVLVVISLTWVIMPNLTKAFRPWLYKSADEVYLRAPKH